MLEKAVKNDIQIKEVLGKLDHAIKAFEGAHLYTFRQKLSIIFKNHENRQKCKYGFVTINYSVLLTEADAKCPLSTSVHVMLRLHWATFSPPPYYVLKKFRTR